MLIEENISENQEVILQFRSTNLMLNDGPMVYASIFSYCTNTIKIDDENGIPFVFYLNQCHFSTMKGDTYLWSQPIYNSLHKEHTFSCLEDQFNTDDIYQNEDGISISSWPINQALTALNKDNDNCSSDGNFDIHQHFNLKEIDSFIYFDETNYGRLLRYFSFEFEKVDLYINENIFVRFFIREEKIKNKGIDGSICLYCNYFQVFQKEKYLFSQIIDENQSQKFINTVLACKKDFFNKLYLTSDNNVKDGERLIEKISAIRKIKLENKISKIRGENLKIIKL